VAALVALAVVVPEVEEPAVDGDGA
jgi:hypothetical protein